MSNPSLLILAGDGIGPEVMDQVKRIITWYGDKRDLSFDVSEDLVGGCAYDAHGTPLHDDTMAKALKADAVLLGAVGGPKYDELDFSVKPERGLLRLRKEMDLFSNLRPAQCFDALADFSSLKKELVAGLDIMIVRELTLVFTSVNHAGFLKKATSALASTHSVTQSLKLTALHVLHLNWPVAVATKCVPWKKPTLWKAAFYGAKLCKKCTTKIIQMLSYPTCTPTTARCSWCVPLNSSTSF